MHTREEKLEAFGRFLDVLDTLREKCPWDRKQTNESLRPNTIEETFELCDALMKDDKKDICKELGDVLLHVCFYAKIASETGDFDIADVCNRLTDKLIFRHPHVYGEVKADTAGEVTQNWEQIKLKEKDGNKSVLGGVPDALPSLIKAYRIQDKARNVGFDWERREDVWDKVREELGELETELAKGDPDKATGESVLVVPGGSYAKNCITYEGYRTAKWLNESGIAAFILKYRLPDGNPDVILEDGRAAIETIRKNAEKFGVNPDEIGVMGFSAGGHFSATLLTQYGSVSARPDFGILVYPVISSEYDNAATFANLLGDNAGAAGHEWDADRNVHENMPPVMIVMCEDDASVPVAQVKSFYEAAVAKDVKIQMHLYPEGGHGFWMRDRYRYGDETYPMIISWIKNNNK